MGNPVLRGFNSVRRLGEKTREAEEIVSVVIRLLATAPVAVLTAGGVGEDVARDEGPPPRKEAALSLQMRTISGTDP